MLDKPEHGVSGAAKSPGGQIQRSVESRDIGRFLQFDPLEKITPPSFHQFLFQFNFLLDWEMTLLFYPNFFKGKGKLPPNKIGLFLIRRHSQNVK